MRTYKKTALLFIVLPLFLNGCIPISTATPREIEEQRKQAEKDRKERHENVLTYTAEDYKEFDAQDSEEIAVELRDEIIQATKDYMKKHYFLDIQVHNILTNMDGVTVHFETKGPIHFYSEVRFPVELANKRLLADNVNYQDGSLDNALKASLYAYMYEEQFRELDRLLGEVAEEHDMVGVRKELIQNIGKEGVMTPFYYTKYWDSDEALIPVYNKYLESPSSSKAELMEVFRSDEFNPKAIEFHIQLFTKDPDTEPDEETLRHVVEKIKTADHLPKGRYIVTLHDNQKEKGRITNKTRRSLKKEFLIEQDQFSSPGSP
ncbi:DUF1672 family protein [Rossellomorea marisflavi]|uniref:DUF1672 family protein n=1 Tax=Rossellomorea marisflavi TaxID=189381 RepID=UPI0035134C5F